MITPLSLLLLLSRRLVTLSLLILLSKALEIPEKGLTLVMFS